MERNLLSREIQNLEFGSRIDFQVTVQSSGTVPANSRRIFVANTNPFKSLPKDVRDETIAELTRQFAFIPAARHKALTISLTEPRNYPEAFSFTDAVVALVPTISHIQPYLDEALKIQGRNAALFFSGLSPSITYTNPYTTPQHSSVSVDTAGRALQNKHIHTVGTKSFAIPYMAATVALDSAIETAVDFIESTFDVGRAKARRKNAPVKYYFTRQGQLDIWHLSVTDNPKDPSKWHYKREQLGVALGRHMAHEVRHLYLAPHAADGLGSASPEVLVSTNNREFSAADKTNILNALNNLAKKQGTVRVVPTFPLQQRTDFPF